MHLLSGRIVNLTSSVHNACSQMRFHDLFFKEEGSYSMFPCYAQSKLCNILFTKELQRRLSTVGCVFDTNISSENAINSPNKTITKRSASPAKRINKRTPPSSPARRRKSITQAESVLTNNIVLTEPSKVVVVAVHPGCVRTEITKNMNYYIQIMNNMASPIMSMIQKSREQGAYSTLHALLAPLSSECGGNSDEMYSVVGGGVYFQGVPLRYVNVMAHDAELAKAVWRISENITELPRRFIEVESFRKKLKQ